jgi:hypothetical protein
MIILQLEITWEDGEDALMGIYTKDLKDGKGIRMRTERQEYPNKRFDVAIEEKLNALHSIEEIKLHLYVSHWRELMRLLPVLFNALRLKIFPGLERNAVNNMQRVHQLNPQRSSPHSLNPSCPSPYRPATSRASKTS